MPPPPVTLEGDTLGEKRRHYNKLVEDAIANKHYELCDIRADDNDIDNLLKIDIASKTRNVDYIIEVLKSNDMLYAATAIKKSTWLITEQQYANIINPEYLHTQLLPSMNSKTFNKLMLHIRLNLKDEKRVETFYEYLRETDSACKWLQNCSISFIENVMKNERLIPLSIFKRLCRRSAHFIAYYTKVNTPSMKELKIEILFFIKSNTAEVLKVLEDKECEYFPTLGRKKTKVLMKACPQRIFDNFDKYADTIDLSSVAKYLNKKNIIQFVYQHAERLGPRLYDHNTLRHFIKNMPKKERFEFVKKTFIDKSEMSFLFTEEGRRIIESKINPYQWYEFAPFDVAFKEIKKLIRKELSSSERCAMLSVLITCTQKNLWHIKELLKFFRDKHINEPLKFKLQFINNLLSELPTHRFGPETWNILDQLFHSMEVYTESENDVQMCMESITVYKVLRNEPVPEFIEQNMKWNSFKRLHRRLKQEHNSKMSKMFTYLLDSVLKKVQSENVAEELGFRRTVVQLKNTLTLLGDWEKDITKFPFVLEKIRQVVEIKREKILKTDISCLYNVNKSWRKHMFEESLLLCMCEEACLNALKHKPQLLTLHDIELDTLRTNDAVSLRRVLAKLRVYWPHSLARQWTDAYRLNLSKSTGQIAAIKGLFMLLPQNQTTDMAKQYVPYDFKINCMETDQTEISIKKNIARNLHVARPLISLDTVLWYAKGDFLQHAVPSLNAILYNMSAVESREHVHKLLDAPVTLLKFGLHLVYLKLKTEELISTYSEVWHSTENISIRGVLFRYTYKRLCAVKNPFVEKELWKLLNFFLSGVFCGRLGHAERVPISVKAEYFMKCYVNWQHSENFGDYFEDLIKYAPQIMNLLDKDFVADKMLSPAGSKFCSFESQFIEIFACYILCGDSEEDQLQRFRRVVGPAMNEAFRLWDETRSSHLYVRNNFTKFLEYLVWNFKTYITLMKTPMPAKLFADIKTKIEKRLSVSQNYLLYTSFKLITEYVKLLDEEGCMFIAYEFIKISELQFRDGQMSSAVENVWKHIHIKISPSFGPVIIKCLKEDTEIYGPTIYSLFAEALEHMFIVFSFQNNDFFILETLKYMLNDSDFNPSYLVVTQVFPDKSEHNDELIDIRKEICTKLKSHPSSIVQMLYYNEFHAYCYR